MKHLFLFATLFVFSFNFVFAQKELKIKVKQGDSIKVCGNKFTQIKLDRKPFSFRYLCKPYDSENKKFYSAQVAVLDNEADLKQISVGKNVDEIPFFAMGTGLAAFFYDTVFINPKAHHYLFYENEKKRRVSLLSNKGDYLQLEWNVYGAYANKKGFSFSDLNRAYLLFVFFIDDNLNGVIDDGEYQVIKVSFK